MRPCGSATAIAADGGAAYVVTTDADGQYDPADIPAVLAPIIEDRADFVSGSRRLGRTYRGDGFRQLGVVFYAGVIRVLTGSTSPIRRSGCGRCASRCPLR